MLRSLLRWSPVSLTLGSRGWRTIAAFVAMLGIVTLLAHELQHEVTAEAPDSCAFAYIANSVPPPPPAICVAAPVQTAFVPWLLPRDEIVSLRNDLPHPARGPPART